MRRRLDLAVSLIGRPRVLFLDEPTKGWTLAPAVRSGSWFAGAAPAHDGDGGLVSAPAPGSLMGGTGIFDRFRSLPIARSAPLTGHVLADLVKHTLSLALILGFGAALGFRTHGSPTAVLAGCG